MRTELIITMITFFLSAALIRYIASKRTSMNTSWNLRIIAGIFGWIFFLSTAIWMILFGDTFAAWLTSPEEEPFNNSLISTIGFLLVYFLSLRANAPYPIDGILNFALVSLSFQAADSASSNKLILFLRKRAFNQFLKEVQPISEEKIKHDRESLIEHLHKQKDIMAGLRQLESGTAVDVVNNVLRPNYFSQHPFFKYLEQLTVNPIERKVSLWFVHPQIEESADPSSIGYARFLREVYDFVQAVTHEPFLKHYSKYFDVLSLSIFKNSNDNILRNNPESTFFLEISTVVLHKIESTYFNPLKLNTLATLRYQSNHHQL